jgi:hypothetical protein
MREIVPSREKSSCEDGASWSGSRRWVKAEEGG